LVRHIRNGDGEIANLFYSTVSFPLDQDSRVNEQYYSIVNVNDSFNNSTRHKNVFPEYEKKNVTVVITIKSKFMTTVSSMYNLHTRHNVPYIYSKDIVKMHAFCQRRHFSTILGKGMRKEDASVRNT
jgi:hypothetical protein